MNRQPIGQMDELNLRDFITVGEAAEIIGVSIPTLRRWDQAGKLRAIKHPISNHRLYRREDLQGFLRFITDQLQDSSVTRGTSSSRSAGAAD